MVVTKPEPVRSSSASTRYPSRRRQATQPYDNGPSSPVAPARRLAEAADEDSGSDIKVSTPPAVVQSLKKEAGIWKDVATKQILEQESWKEKANKAAEEKESWKEKAEKQARETDTWKSRARLLKKNYTDKKYTMKIC